MELLDVREKIESSSALMLYFGAPSCNVCHALKPKLFDSIAQQFPLFTILDIDISQNPEIAASFTIFSIPTVVIYLEGKEFVRKSRNMSVEVLMQEIARPYNIMTQV